MERVAGMLWGKKCTNGWRALCCSRLYSELGTLGASVRAGGVKVVCWQAAIEVRVERAVMDVLKRMIAQWSFQQIGRI